MLRTKRPSGRRSKSKPRAALIGEQVRQARAAKGMTQSELARLIGKSVPTISKIESGNQAVDLDQLIAIGQALGFSPAAMLLRVQRMECADDPIESEVLDELDALVKKIDSM